MIEVAQIDGRERFNKFRAVSKIRPLLNRLKFVVAFSIPLTLITSCEFFQTTETTEFRYPQECNQLYPKVCVDTHEWPDAGVAYIAWRAPEGTVTNNIYERNSLDEPVRGIAGVGPQKIDIMSDPGTDNVRKLDVTLERGLVLAVNPQKDHYLSVRACKSAGDCLSSEEIKIPHTP